MTQSTKPVTGTEPAGVRKSYEAPQLILAAHSVQDTLHLASAVTDGSKGNLLSVS